MLKQLCALLITATLSSALAAQTNPAPLKALVAGTAVSPSLSGLQVSLLKGGQIGESYAFGFAQTGPGGITPLR
ncbi:MAG: hypothetical protein NWQ45_14095, partial [Congregibacter sp.]|nr:hypothetical protein [Congregibacter sp.]